MLEFIDIVDKRPGLDFDHASHVQIHKDSWFTSDSEVSTLRVSGVIPHGAQIRPRTRKDAVRLIEWLTAQLETLE